MGGDLASGRFDSGQDTPHTLSICCVQLPVFDYKQRAIAVYDKPGFRQEGVFREFLQRDGKRYDMARCGLLRREWQREQS